MKKLTFLSLLFIILVASCGTKPVEQLKEKVRMHKKSVPPKKPKTTSNKIFPTVANDAMSYVLASPAVEKNGEIVHFYRGYFSDKKKQYPIMIAFIEKNGKIRSARYKNINYSALVKMNVNFSSHSMTLDGEAGNEEFSIYLTSDNGGRSWTGTAVSNYTLDVFLEPTAEQFKF